ncbi:hypothetical protein D6C77_03778 [Aureobasidium pullulans]|nr:hypothetical protein D6C77_03778 [Aureobasidium pullulans]
MSAEDFAGQWDAGEHCLANNPVLVALAQNGALRLRCDRATISLLDDLRLSVIAEATPSTSPFGLQEHALYREHDPTSRSIAVFSHSTGHESIASHDFVADTTRLVVRDIRTLDQPEDCSHQVAPSHLVSFAEVPIRNPSGHLLGTYCIIDDKVRHDFFHDETTLVLTDIANAISTFLELHTSTTIPNSCLAHCLDDQPIQLLRQHMTPSSDSSQTDQPRSETTFSFHHSLDTPRSEASDFAFALPTPDRCSSASNSHTASPDFDAHESKHVFSEAARQICAAINFEGLAFLDTFADNSSLELPPVCEVLGSFVAPKACKSGSQDSVSTLHEDSLNYLTRQYPRGCAFLASDQGITVLGDSDVSTGQNGVPKALDITSELPSDLQSLIISSRSLIFLPLWDSSLQRFYVGMIGWSRDPTRVFARQDVACLAAFGRSFMMELGRSEAIDMEGTKSDFVSSISHELRSPLHGALAAVEFLQETKLDDTQAELVEMVQTCASTLLDTLNHLLDFSKVNELKGAKSRARKESDIRLNHSQNTFGSSTETYLCTILQDVVEGVHFGRSSQQAAFMRAKTSPIDKLAFSTHPGLLLDTASDADTFLAAKTADAVAVYLDVQNQAEWCTTLPAGAWKRLVMNLFANALKFTSEGFVEISLKLVEDGELQQKRVHLKISDSGIGMSEEYMKLHLYQPFVQENQLVSGIGLGLSIVKQIVDDLNGTISVESTLGVGTRFDVSVPLCEQDAQCRGKVPSGGEILDPDAALKGLTLCILSPHDPSTSHTDIHSRRLSTMQSYVRSIAEDWFGMDVITAQTTAQARADIYITEALQFVEGVEVSAEALKSNRYPTILIGPWPGAKVSRNGLYSNTIRLAYPLGPKALGRALFAALENPVEPDEPHEAISIKPKPSQPAQESLTNGLEVLDLDQQSPLTPTRPDKGQIEESIMSEHVLLVDDNAINLKLLAAYVKKLGFSAELAVDGQDAYQKYQAASQRKPFTTILMDISMPVMDGFGSSRAIRNYEATNSISPPARIIALTGLGSDTSKREAELSGMDDFRTKPVALKTLKVLLSS